MHRPAMQKLLLCGWLLALGLLFPAAWAAARDDEETTSQSSTEQPEAAGMANLFAPENFERWMFQHQGSAEKARQRLVSQLKLKLGELTRTVNITADQQDKLRLAAAVDVERLFADVEIVRHRFLKVTHDQQGMQDIWKDMFPLQQRIQAGVLGEGSFFSKSLRQILSAAQGEAVRRGSGERTRFRYRAVLEIAVLDLDDELGLTAEQHAALVNLALENTKPPRMFGMYDTTYVGLQLSKLPADKTKPLLNDRQWQRLNKHFGQFQGMQPFLVEQGIMEQ